MIKKIMYGSLLALLVTTGAQAEQSMKICIYDPEIVMAKAKEWADSISAIDKKYQQKADELKKEEDALRDEAAKLQKDANTLKAKSSIMNEAAREEAEAALTNRKDMIERKMRDYEENRERIGKSYQQDRQKVGMRFFKKLEDSIRGFAQANSYDLVLPKGPGIYASPTADQSEALTSYLNSGYEGGKSGAIVAKK